MADVSVSEWGNRHWQWVLRAPVDHDPVLDTTGEKCHWDQSGPVWFLAGAYNDQPLNRRCRIPQGKHILVPIAASLVVARPLDDKLTCPAQVDEVKRGSDGILRPYLTLNGEAVDVLKNHRVSSKDCFDAAGRGRKLSASDGYFVLLRPLPLGKHVLKFGNDEQGPARRQIQVLLEIVDPNEALPPLSWNALALDPSSLITRRAQPLMGAVEVARRFAALVAADRRYVTVTSPTRYEDWPINISVVPACLKDLEGIFPDLAQSLERPLELLALQEDGQTRLQLIRLGPQKSDSSAIRDKINHDLSRFLTEALDKRVRVHDEDVVFANEQRLLNRWQDVTAHRGGRKRPADLHDTDAWCLAAASPHARAFYEATFGVPRGSTVTFMRPRATLTYSVVLSNDALTASASYTHGMAKVSRSYAEGRLYAEFRFGAASTSGKAERFLVNIAVEGDSSTYPDPDSEVVDMAKVQITHGDIVGLALDFDRREVSCHVNGVWMPRPQPIDDQRAPGSLPGEGPYSVFVRMRGGAEGERDTWTANFGASKFAYPIPKGYTPYNEGPPRYSFESGSVSK